MPTYIYRALDTEGKEVSETITVSGRKAVLDRLALKNLCPVSVEEYDVSSTPQPGTFSRTGRVSRSDVEAFTRELANLLSAGVPLSRSLAIGSSLWIIPFRNL